MEAKPKRVLIIEDDEYLASILGRLLMLEGFEAETQTSGTRGLVQAAERPPDLVILDLKLPDVHGYQVCRELRKLHGSWTVPILMLTGMDQPIDQLRGYAYGADAYLTKPCQSDELLKTVKLLMGELSLT